MMFEHPVAGGVDVLGFEAAVVDLVPVIRPVSTAATIVRSDHGIALLNHLADDMDFFVCGHIAVYFAMSEDNERESPRGPEREKGHR